jgi:hypothetical protein
MNRPIPGDAETTCARRKKPLAGVCVRESQIDVESKTIALL